MLISTNPVLRRSEWLLPAAIFASFFFNIWGVPLFDLDEGAFSEATREMFLRGDFLSTYLNGEPRNDKPILIYWLQAASVSLFGFNEFGLRLPSALAASGWVLMVYYFVTRVADRRRALVAALITATCLEISVMGKAATADALFNFCIASSMMLFFLHYRFLEKKYLYLSFLCIGLGFLTKGPVAVMVPLVVSLLFCLLRKEFRFWLAAVFNPLGILIFLLIGLPWYVISYFHDGGAFINDFLFNHNLGRFESAKEGHSGKFFYYVPIVILGVLPYTAALFLVLRRIPALIKDDLSLYLLFWFGFVFLFFSFSSTKLPHYVVYGYTAMTILMALYFDQLRRRWLGLLPILLFLAVLLLLPEILEMVRSRSHDEFLVLMLSNHQQDLGSSYRWIVLAGLLAVGYLLFEKRIELQQALLASGFVTVLVVASALLPAVAAVQQQPIRDAAMLAREQGLTVVQWHLKMPSFNVYSETISPRRLPQPGDYVLTKGHHLQKLDIERQLFNRNGIALVKLKN